MKAVLLILVGVLGFISSAQTSLEQTGKINAGLQGVDFSYELPMSNQFIWESSAGLGIGMNVKSNKSTYNFYLFDPVVSVATGLKWMYNREKRESRDRNNSNNAGNYFGLQTKYSFGHSVALDMNQALLTDIHWGIQRNIGQKFVLNTNIGLGYMNDFETNYGDIAPTLRVKIGYLLF